MDDVFTSVLVCTVPKIPYPCPLVFLDRDLLVVEKSWSDWLRQHQFLMWMDTKVRYFQILTLHVLLGSVLPQSVFSHNQNEPNSECYCPLMLYFLSVIKHRQWRT